MSSDILRVSIAPQAAIKAYTRDIASGRRRRTIEDPDVWFSSIESFAKVLSEKNRALLSMIAEQHPESIEALAEASGRATSNLSRTLRTMQHYKLVRIEKGKGRRLKPVVNFKKLKLTFSVAA